MKFLVVFAAMVAAAAAAPSAADREAVVLVNENNNIGVGDYDASVQTSNGITSQTQGRLIILDEKNLAVAVKGSSSYVGDDGKTYAITYIADENGYRAEADYLPK